MLDVVLGETSTVEVSGCVVEYVMILGGPSVAEVYVLYVVPGGTSTVEVSGWTCDVVVYVLVVVPGGASVADVVR